MKLTVGNDVVDLTSPRIRDRAGDERFTARVLTPAERRAVARAPDPDLELWYHWAAKEAAFKVVSKLQEDPPLFVHRAFEVSWAGEAGAPDGPRRGQVSHLTRVVQIFGELDSEGRFLHVTGLWRDDRDMSGRSAEDGATSLPPRAVRALDDPGAFWNADLDTLHERLTERERSSVHSIPSAAVRIGARAQIERVHGLAPNRVEIVCGPGPLGRSPPRILLDGGPSEIDLSLSHDGPWIAWVCTPPEKDCHGIP